MTAGGGRVRTALVTGASSGIGLEICRLLARDSARVVMVARDEGRLQRAARWVQAEVTTAALTLVPADLSVPGSAAALHARVERDVGPVDFLANNAGAGLAGRFADADPVATAALVALNVTGLTDLTRPYLRDMLARRAGRILNVASTAAYLPGPGMAVYYATKAFVLSFSEALSEETAGSGVTVTALCPGPMATGFQERAGIAGTRLLQSRLVMPAAVVAATGYRGALEGKRVVIPGLANRLMVEGLRFLPRSVAAAMAGRAHQPAGGGEGGGAGGGGGA
jgi:short-subunit dehydrogenase